MNNIIPKNHEQKQIPKYPKIMKIIIPTNHKQKRKKSKISKNHERKIPKKSKNHEQKIPKNLEIMNKRQKISKKIQKS